MMNFEDFKRKYQKVEIEHFPNSVPKNVKVSVLVQTYNHENFLENCLDSILNQKTKFDFEIILGEDQSSDHTCAICLQYAEKFPERIRLFLHRKENKISVNGITTGNFNAIYNLFSARGTYIAFCEGDDYWTDPLKLQKQVDFLDKNEEYVLSYHEFLNIGLENQIISSIEDHNQPRIEISQKSLVNIEYHPLLLTVCFRNKLKKLPEHSFKVINVDTFILSLLGSYGCAKFLNNIQPSYYRKHMNGIWSSKMRIKNLKTKAQTFQKLSDYYFKINNFRVGNNFRQKALRVQKMLIWSHLKCFRILQLLESIFNYSKLILK